MHAAEEPAKITTTVMDLPLIDKFIITSLTDNYYDALRKDEKVAYRFGIWNQDQFPPIICEMGLSYYIEAISGSEHRHLMCDFSYTSNALLHNVDLLGINPSKVEALVLSHGHKDHWGGVYGLLDKHRMSMHQDLPIYIGEETFYPRWFVFEDGRKIYFDKLDEDKIKKYDVKITEVKEPTIVAGLALSTGSIEQVTDFEKGSPILNIEKEKIMRDSFIGEQALVFNVKDKGLVVITSCAHRGVINTVKYAEKITGIDKVHAVVGGFHLSGAKPEVIGATLGALKDINPDYVIPMHCSGAEAIRAMADEMPDKYIVTAVGSRYIFQ